MRRLNALVVLMLVGLPAMTAAQTADERRALASQIEQRFDVLPVQNGLVLRPKRADAGVRSIELTNGAIAIDGTAVTGAELKQRLPADADSILRVSYLSAAEQRTLFGARQPAAPAEAVAPVAPAPAVQPEAPEPPRAPGPPRRRRGSSEDRVRFGGSVEVREGEVIDGDVVAIGGGATVNGEVHGDTVAIGGNLELGPKAVVDGDAVVVGGALHRDPGAQVSGEISEVGVGGAFGRGGFGNIDGAKSLILGGFGSAFALITTITRLAVLCILASVVMLFGRGYVERIGSRAAAEPLKAGAVGLLVQLLFLPVLVATILVMVITIVGIPLLVLIPFAILAFAVLFLVGFTAVVYDIGRLASHRFGWEGLNPYVLASIGVALVLSPILLSRLVGLGGFFLSPITWTLWILGILAEYVVWTIGLGAVALLRFDRRSSGGTSTPPVPAIA